MARTPRKLAIPRDWTFRSPDVARRFDSHVRESLPWYELATGIVAHVARSYVPIGGHIIDVGCSTGNVARSLAGTLRARDATILGFDSAPEMAKVYAGPGRFTVADARTFDFLGSRPDLIICFLSLMFVPVKDRAVVLAKMRNAVTEGGAVLVFDKMIPRPGYVGTVSYRLTLAAKQEAGASPAEIIAKELSVSGVQRPMSESELDGFVEVFRFGDFAGFVFERHP